MNKPIRKMTNEELVKAIYTIMDWVGHDSWRCKYGKCACGLDKLCEELGIDKIDVSRSLE